jgi:DNA-binding NarL/FixJ family response regulator
MMNFMIQVVLFPVAFRGKKKVYWVASISRASTKMTFCKILIVDDFEPLRRFVCAMFDQNPEFQVVGEAADGLEAVNKATDLRPDLILLDVSLPKLNGVAAARQIRICAPASKILFMSEHWYPELVEEALDMGASGYVIKSEAANDLFDALRTVIHGDKFVSRPPEEKRLRRGSAHAT